MLTYYHYCYIIANYILVYDLEIVNYYKYYYFYSMSYKVNLSSGYYIKCIHTIHSCSLS